MWFDDRYANEARQLLAYRCPLEYLEDGRWVALGPYCEVPGGVADAVYDLPPERAVEVAMGIIVRDVAMSSGNRDIKVRFAIDRAEFLERDPAYPPPIEPELAKSLDRLFDEFERFRRSSDSGY